MKAAAKQRAYFCRFFRMSPSELKALTLVDYEAFCEVRDEELKAQREASRKRK